MKRIFLTIVFLFCILFLVSGQEIEQKAIITRNQIEILHIVDSLLLDGLPNSFDEYVALYGDDGPLNSSISVIEHLYHSDVIDYDDFIKRIVNISVGASPGVDHINYLDDVVHSLLNNNLPQVVFYLNRKTFDDNTQFWAFVFGGVECRDDDTEKDTIKKELRKLSRIRFDTKGRQHDSGYKYIQTVDIGFKRSEQYLIHH